MTAEKEQALNLVKAVPDDQMFLILPILRNIVSLTHYEEVKHTSQEKMSKAEAYDVLMNYVGVLPSDIDEDKDKTEWLKEKYDSIN